MRILASHVDPVSGHTYAVIVNPVADTALPTLRYRLIMALSPNWVHEVNTIQSVSRTRGISIYEEFDCLATYTDTPSIANQIERLKKEAKDLATVLTSRNSP